MNSMKKILVILISSLLSFNLHSQTEKKFDYKLLKSGNYVVTPLFNQTKGVGKGEMVSWSDENYFNNLFLSIIKEVLSKEKQDSLHLNTVYVITFNFKGEVLNCKFFINNLDKDVLSEKDLYSLYMRFMNLKIDMSKVKIGSNLSSDDKNFDYSEISGSLITKENRDKLNKEYEDKILKKNK